MQTRIVKNHKNKQKANKPRRDLRARGGVNEKTGIQVLERINPGRTAIPGNVARLEFEYGRHGTRALTPSVEVGTGKIIAYYLEYSRNGGKFRR